MLPLLAGSNIDRTFVTHTVAQVIDLVVHVERQTDGIRRVREILRPDGIEDGRILTETIFDTRSGTLERVPSGAGDSSSTPVLSSRWGTL
jgi:pilus assembly protein CpaF